MKMFKGQIEWKDGYELRVYKSHFCVYNSNGNEVYYEYISGYWRKHKFDEHGNELYFENSEGKVIDNRKKDITLRLTEEQIKQVRELIK